MPKLPPPYPPEFRQRRVEWVQAGRIPEALSKRLEPLVCHQEAALKNSMGLHGVAVTAVEGG